MKKEGRGEGGGEADSKLDKRHRKIYLHKMTWIAANHGAKKHIIVSMLVHASVDWIHFLFMFGQTMESLPSV